MTATGRRFCDVRAISGFRITSECRFAVDDIVLDVIRGPNRSLESCGMNSATKTLWPQTAAPGQERCLGQPRGGSAQPQRPDPLVCGRLFRLGPKLDSFNAVNQPPHSMTSAARRCQARGPAVHHQLVLDRLLHRKKFKRAADRLTRTRRRCKIARQGMTRMPPHLARSPTVGQRKTPPGEVNSHYSAGEGNFRISAAAPSL